MADTRKTLADYTQHLSNCAIYYCGSPRGSEHAIDKCRATIDAEIHYIGTVDSHKFEKQPCDCGLHALLATPDTPEAREALAQLIDRLENVYDFQCEGGPLRNCVEWQQLTAALRALPPQTSAPAPPPTGAAT